MFKNHSGKLLFFSETKLKFLLVGLVNTIFGYAIFAILVFSHVSHSVALFSATVMGVVFNYFSTGRLVFKSRGGLVVFLKFVMTYAVVYFTNAIELEFLINNLKIMPYLAQALCLPANVLLSWLLMNNWVYVGD